MSYEECSLFETSTTQMPILSCIKSLAVHINTFQAQIKKCKQNKKIYIYIIFPLSKGFKSQCSKSFWTQNLRSTLFSWDKQVPAKATAFLTHEVGDHGRHGRGRGKERGEEREWEGNRYALGKGRWAAGTRTWWVGEFYLLDCDIFFLDLLNPPSPGPTMVENPHRSRQSPIRPAQSLQSTPGWPIVACGGASQSSHRQAGPVD